MEEIWKDVPGWIGVFQVSNTGRSRVSPGCNERLACVRRVFRSKSLRFLFHCPGSESWCPTVQQAIYSAFGPDPRICLRSEDEWLPGEEWRDVGGDFAGRYFISNLGRLRQTGEPGNNVALGKVLKPAFKKGYPCYRIQSPGRHRDVSAHVLMAEAFMGPAPEWHEVNHVDGDRANCRLDNLEYVTRRQNCLHATRVLGRSGERNPAAKLTWPIVNEIRRLKVENRLTSQQIADKLEVMKRHVDRILQYKTWIERDQDYRSF